MLTIVLAGALWAVCGGALADSLDVTVREPMRLVAEWEADRNYALTIVAIVFILGALIALINALPNDRAKLGAVVLGSAVTVLTGVANLVFEFDHRQYKVLAREGRSLLDEIEYKRGQLKEMPTEEKANRSALTEEIRRDARTIVNLAQSLKERSPKTGALGPGGPSGGIISTAWAQQGRVPAWTSAIPTDDANLYFVGFADGRDYQAVRKASEQLAYDDARAFLAGQLESAGKAASAEAAAAAGYLLEAARVADTYVAYDKTQNTYRAYTLLALGRKLAGTDLQLFAAKNSVALPPAQAQALQAAARKPDDYLAQRVQVYTNESNKAQAALPPAQYDQYTRARKLRLEGKTEEAIAQLKDVVRLQPDFYLGWFNLALAYDERKDFVNGNSAYERAIALESKGKLRDASLYNSYGFFLFKQKKYREAAGMLKTALELAPDHPKARTTLAAAQAAAGP
ncbi:MAG: hypothetical protein HYX47_15990 [Burkholderiales bacterium]|nr:hypothetical protein [Burkholderiales bacterium]